MASRGIDRTGAAGGSGTASLIGAFAELADPGADAFVFWDDSAGGFDWFAATGGGVVYSDGSSYALQSGATFRTTIGLGTTDSPQFTAVEVGHASDTTLARAAAGRLSVEGVAIVRGPASATDTAIPRFNGTTGDLIQNSGVIINGSNNISGVADLAITGNISGVVDLTLTGTLLGVNGALRSVQVYAGGATWTKPANLKSVFVRVIGGGGGGGGGVSGGNPGGGGGGGGGYAEKLIAAASLGATETVTIGAAGSGGLAGANGTAGGTSSFGAHCSATGGALGGGAGGVGGAGGQGSGGSFNMAGGPGGSPSLDTGSTQYGGPGGNSVVGGGAVSGGSVSVSSGGGGGGGGSGNQPGGNGATGLVIVWELF